MFLMRISIRRDAHYPTNIRIFKNGIAEVEWQVSPDGMYYMDDDGYGMTNDVEISLFGYIDRSGHVVGPFTYIGGRGKWDLDKMKAVKEVAISKANRKQ